MLNEILDNTAKIGDIRLTADGVGAYFDPFRRCNIFHDECTIHSCKQILDRQLRRPAARNRYHLTNIEFRNCVCLTVVLSDVEVVFSLAENTKFVELPDYLRNIFERISAQC